MYHFVLNCIVNIKNIYLKSTIKEKQQKQSNNMRNVLKCFFFKNFYELNVNSF